MTINGSFVGIESDAPCKNTRLLSSFISHYFTYISNTDFLESTYKCEEMKITDASRHTGKKCRRLTNSKEIEKSISATIRYSIPVHKLSRLCHSTPYHQQLLRRMRLPFRNHRFRPSVVEAATAAAAASPAPVVDSRMQLDILERAEDILEWVEDIRPVDS